MARGSENIKGYPRSTEEARERGKRGGVASGETRRKKQAMRQVARIILGLLADPTDETRDMLSEMQGETDVQTIALAAQAKKAMAGDLRALQFLRDTAGETPGSEEDRKTDNPFQPRMYDNPEDFSELIQS